MKERVNLRYSLLIILLISFSLASAQSGGKIDKSYKWSYKLDTDGTVELNNYDCDIIIHTWDKEMVEMELFVVADMRTGDNAGALDKHIKNLDFANSPSMVSLDTKFWQSRIQVATRKMIKLDRGLNLRYSDLKIKAEVWMPGTADLEMNSKYSRIDLETVGGELYLNLYNDDLDGKGIGSKAKIEAKYAKIEFEKCSDIEADLYDCDLTTDEMGNCLIKSKYSKVVTGDALSQRIDSYNDKFTYESCGDIDMVAKYTDLKANRAGNVKVDSYEGSVEIVNCINMEIKSKYTDFAMNSARDIIISSIYEGSVSSAGISSVYITESKYADYKLDHLESSFELIDGYEDDIFIDELSSYFKAIELNGKYLKCETAYNNDLDLKFLAKIKYPHLNTENVDLTTRVKISESSDLEFEAYKGKERDDMPLISLNGYEIRFTFK